MNFEAYVHQFQTLYLDARGQKPETLEPLARHLGTVPKRIVIVAPHPDDECLMAGIALRAKLEHGAEVAVLPFTYGSMVNRQRDRKTELDHALQILHFTKLDPRGSGEDELDFDQVKLALLEFCPDAVILPHPRDGHSTHIRCSEIAIRATLEIAQEEKRRIQVFQSEFWQSLESPNLLLPLSEEVVTRMGKALLCHVGEIERNPYHLTLPAWLMDQVRRGSEIHKGGAKGNTVFGQLYRFDEIG